MWYQNATDAGLAEDLHPAGDFLYVLYIHLLAEVEREMNNIHV